MEEMVYYTMDTVKDTTNPISEPLPLYTSRNIVYNGGSVVNEVSNNEESNNEESNNEESNDSNYICQHCGSDLDLGDIFEHFLTMYGDREQAKESAKSYGYTETNKKHFNRSTIIKQIRGPQYVICPDCGNRDPLLNKCELPVKRIFNRTY